VLGEVLLLGELLCPAGFSAKKDTASHRDSPAEQLQAVLPCCVLESHRLPRTTLAGTNHLILKISSQNFLPAQAST